MLEMQAWSLGWEDPWRRKWQPTLVFLPGESHGQRSLTWGHRESDTIEHTYTAYEKPDKDSAMSDRDAHCDFEKHFPLLCNIIFSNYQRVPAGFGLKKLKANDYPEHLKGHSVQFSSVQSLSCVQLFATLWTAARQASLSITNSRSPLKLMSIDLVMPSNYLILSSPSPPTFNFPSIRVFLNESALCIRWPKYWNFSFNTSPSNSGLISFRMDWLDLLEVQRTLKSLLQHHSSKASILQHSAFFIDLLSHPYMTTGKTIAFMR